MIPKYLKGDVLFKWLMEHKTELIDMKKSMTKIADVVTMDPEIVKPSDALKGRYLYEDDKAAGILKRTIVANTYNWLDSHDDVLVNGVFAKSISERGARAPHLHDHIFEIGAKVGKPIKYFEADISWRELGLGKTGMTQALMMESEIRKSYNERVYEDYLNGEVDQHSVRLRYMDIGLAINDEDEEAEYKLWQEVFPKLGNKKQAEGQGFFFVVKQAQLIETSAVLMGANELTPTMPNKEEPMKNQPSEDIEDQPPTKALDIDSILNYYKLN